MSDTLNEDLAAMDAMLEPEEETPAEPEAQAEPEPPDPEDVPEETPEEPAEETAEQKLLAGKYQTPEELERGYQELQSRLGEQGTELGELRKTLDKLNENLEYEEPVQVNQTTVDWLDEQVEENPARAALYALQNDPSGALYERVMGAWFDMPGEARNASEFVTAVAVDRLRREFTENLEKQTKPLSENAERDAMGRAWSQAAREIPALKDESVVQLVMAEAKDAPEILEKIRTGSEEERVKGFRKLYKMAMGEQAVTVKDVTAESAAAEASASRAAKKAGTVATGTTVADAETVSEGDAWLESIGFDAVLDRHSPPE